jgi:Mg2+-importing ATPase
MLLLVVSIFAINLALGRPWLESFLFSLAIAVGLTPQLLPAIVSISLSLGARLMARASVIVKRLSAIEDLGGMDILCTDKTGTLTIGTVELEAALGLDGKPSARVLQLAALNAGHHTGFSNPIDEAILKGNERLMGGSRRLAEVPYDFMRKRLSVLVEFKGSSLLVTKGALDNILSACTDAERVDGTSAQLSDLEAAIRGEFERLSGDGYRVLGVAVKPLEPRDSLSPADEAGMTFTGFLAFQDPAKPGAESTLRELASIGISLRMVTGDNPLAARHIAEKVGLNHGAIVTGEEISQATDNQLVAMVASVDVFAAVDPVQKERIVRAFRHGGHTVGFLGDGINDAPALHSADVGISVDTAVDVAKDSASVVLLSKDLAVLMQGVRLGRQTFANTLKYVFVTTSANFGNMASMAGASLFLPYLPLLPMQFLLLNFLSDLPATTISGDSVDPEQVRSPESWNIHSVRNFMVVFGLISSVFDFLTFGTLRVAFDASEALFRSGWFLESLGTELAVMLILRTRRPFFRSRPGTLLLATSFLTALIGMTIVLTPAGEEIGFVTPPPKLLLALIGILAAYVLATEIGKRRFYAPHERG